MDPTGAFLVAQWYRIHLPNAGDSSLIPGSGRSPGGGNGNPLQYTCLENSMDRGVAELDITGVTKHYH